MFHKGKIFLLNKYQSVMDWERQISYGITYMWNLKKRLQMNLSTKQTVTDGENKLIVIGGKKGKG